MPAKQAQRVPTYGNVTACQRHAETESRTGADLDQKEGDTRARRSVLAIGKECFLSVIQTLFLHVRRQSPRKLI